MHLIGAVLNTATASVPVAASSDPAGGAAIGQVIIATGFAMVATAVLVYFAWAHRVGRNTALRQIAERAAEGTGMTPWAALPVVLATASLLTAVFGMYWDISLHIDQGRDPGPLANPAHYFILVGLFGIFAAGLLAVVLPEEKPGPAAVRISGDWYAPVGAIVLLACSSFALAGFPLDDVWHRLFGQDVTLWGPTHLMLIGGAGLSLLGIAALSVEGRREESQNGSGVRGSVTAFISRYRAAFACGGLLIGLSTFQGEFDFGVPQFRFIFQPILIATAAGIALVTARIYVGRGGALAAAGFFILVRGSLALLVGPLLGEVTPHFPLYLAEAACVELVALAVPPDRGYRFGALSGAAIGTVGFAAEYGWSHVWMPIAWPQALVGEALALTAVAGVAAGLVGSFVGRSLTAERSGAPAGLPAVAGAVAIFAIVAYGLQTGVDSGVRASVAVTDVQAPPDREVSAKIRIDPPSAAEDADWLNVTAWQGGERLVLDNLRETGSGSYETTEPIPVNGDWKSTLRLQKGDSIAGLPIYMPADPAIPVGGIPANPTFTRSFELDHKLLQREQKQDVPSILPPIAYAVVGSITLGLVALLGWALVRLGRRRGGGPEPRPERRAGAVPAAGGTA